jgi:macrodomain Ter protein organizer (MatP/YcbG family)
MKDKNIKKVTVQVSNDCWKKLKILSIQKEITLAEQVVQLLERSVSNRKIETITEE